jgi:hypothetical protein
MAGFDWFFTYDADDEAVVRAMLAAGRRRARRLDVRWRSSIDSPQHHAYVAVDGPGWLLDLLVARLDRDLPTICEAIEESPRIPALRRRLGHHFVQIAIDRRFSRDDFKPIGWIPHLQARKQPAEQFGHYLLECPEAPDLQQRLAVTERMLVDWYFDEVAPEVMIEELHTAFELTLARIIYGRYRRDKAFQQLIDEARTLGVFDKVRRIVQFMPEYDWARNTIDPQYSPAPYVAELLTSLKDTRKHVRHRGDTSARAWLDDHFDAAAVALEKLAELARTLPPDG